MVKIEAPTDRNADLKVVVINHGAQLTAELTWADWKDLEHDVRYLRRYKKAWKGR